MSQGHNRCYTYDTARHSCCGVTQNKPLVQSVRQQEAYWERPEQEVDSLDSIDDLNQVLQKNLEAEGLCMYHFSRQCHSVSFTSLGIATSPLDLSLQIFFALAHSSKMVIMVDRLCTHVASVSRSCFLSRSRSFVTICADLTRISSSQSGLLHTMTYMTGVSFADH